MLRLCLAALAAAGCGHDGSEPARELAPAPAESTVPAADGDLSADPGPMTVVAAILTPAPRPTGPLPADAGCITSACHTAYLAARYIHGAVSTGDCTVCHEADQGDHTYPLKRDGNEGCTFCHATTGNRMFQHAATEAPHCTACHQPHVSDTKFLLTAPTVQALCFQCHIAEPKAYPHGPFASGECIACHQAHESNNERLLRGGEGPAHCALCHAETMSALANAPHVHAPAAEGCTTCHDPHTSDFEHALKQSIEQTCFSCHKDLEQHVTGSAAPHAAVFTAQRCANCHDPHASGRPSLLRERQDVLCLQCHNQPIWTAEGRTIPDMTPTLRHRRFLHGPVRSGDCTACHNVHGASHSRLLRAQFTDAFYAAFDLRNYALCFSCHERELVTAERTTALTDFRDGDLNLHFLHVNRQRKGRTCRACHAIHGSDLPKHVAETVPFEGSGWAMPIGFEKTEVGGSCAPGCHEPLAYRRDRKPHPQSDDPGGGAP
ncbi:MAG: cytochrome c3 family protein [Planctomycetota bacterium]